jgi:Na+/melibiose symporter-like transporter
LPLTCVASFASAAGLAYAAAVDYNELQLGRRDEAKIFGFGIFAREAALASNAILLGQLLEVAQFVANQQQSAGVLLDMKAIMTLVPLLGMLITAGVMAISPRRKHARECVATAGAAA